MKNMLMSLGLLFVTGNALAYVGKYTVTNKTADRFDVTVDIDRTSELFEGHGPVVMPGHKVAGGEFGEKTFHEQKLNNFILDAGQSKTIMLNETDERGVTETPKKIVVLKQSARAGVPIGLHRLEADINGYAAEITEKDGDIAIEQLRYATGYKKPVILD